MTRPVRIANASGFYGDRLAAMHEVIDGGPVDVVTGDYLAELTMLILWKARRKDPSAGYARTFLTQLEQVLGTALDRGIKIVANAGGLNPSGLADRIGELAARLGLAAKVAWIDGDDLAGRIDELLDAGHELAHLDTGRPLRGSGVVPVTANAYLGGWGITAALAAGADIVVCPRVTDASLTSGPAAWWHGWERTDFDQLAGAVAAGLPVDRYQLANLHALNFVVTGLLGNGVADATRPDPQAKGLGEYLRSRFADLPARFLADDRSGHDQ